MRTQYTAPSWEENYLRAQVVIINQFLPAASGTWVICLASVLITLGACGKNSSDDVWLKYVGQAKAKAGNYLAAEALYIKAKDRCETIFGKNDARTGTCLGYLAELYRGEQEYVKAAIVYRRLIEIEERCAPNSAELEEDLKEYQDVLAKLKEYGLDKTPDQSKEEKEIKPKNDGQ
jgi:tetratricopeptide (TPR) repeat protein